MLKILRLQAVADEQVDEIKRLMVELDPEISVTSDMVRAAVETPETCFFALMNDGHIVGCASLCVCHSPTGTKAHIEDVVVLSSYRGQHLGRRMIEYVIEYAKKELKPVELFLTSRPKRVAANELYQSLGFRQKVTNVYLMEIKS
jgi:ribosomal protein S18 acetylase RimI-like enzyme